MIKAILYIWQLPQNILGLIFMQFYTDRILILKYNNVAFYASRKMKGGISLGKYIILSSKQMLNISTYSHEYGHYKQSLIFGWLYLSIIGLYSLLIASMVSCPLKYHKKWTESWANKLGGIPQYNGTDEMIGIIKLDRGYLIKKHKELFND